ncbi:MAG: hypothetical protein RR415_06515, partial [Ruthenibacterium sp.]
KVAFSLLAYPAVKWSLTAKETELLINHFELERANGKTNSEIVRLEKIQKALVNASGLSPNLHLRKREKYFKYCQELITAIDCGIASLHSLGANGSEYGNVLTEFFTSSTVNALSRHRIKRYMGDAIAALSEQCGETIDAAFDLLVQDDTPRAAELAYLYHNVDLLLTEYARILWKSKGSADSAMQLLSCKDARAMHRVTKQEGKYAEAYLIVEYVKLIHNAIEQLRQFPHDGEKYYEIVMAIIDGKPQSLTGEQVAQKMNVTSFTFSTRRRNAFSVLGCILWGHDIKPFLDLLSY